MAREYRKNLVADNERFINGLTTHAEMKADYLTPEILTGIYRNGFFAVEANGFILRRSSDVREIVPLTKPLDIAKMPDDVRKALRKARFTYSWNKASAEVLKQCSRPDLLPRDRWLGPELQKTLLDLGRRGIMHTLEIWAGDVLAAGSAVAIIDNVPVDLTAFVNRQDRACAGAGYVAMFVGQSALCRAGFKWLDSTQPTELSRMQGGRLENAMRVNGWRDEAARRPRLAFSPQPGIFPAG